MPTPQGFRDLRVYQLAYQLAMEIFHESKDTRCPTRFVEPPEVWPLTSQKAIARSATPKCS